jgi:hypothetical protein
MIHGTLYIDNFIQNDMYLFDTLRDTASWDRRVLSRLTTFGVSYDYSGVIGFTPNTNRRTPK